MSGDLQDQKMNMLSEEELEHLSKLVTSPPEKKVLEYIVKENIFVKVEAFDALGESLGQCIVPTWKNESDLIQVNQRRKQYLNYWITFQWLHSLLKAQRPMRTNQSVVARIVSIDGPIKKKYTLKSGEIVEQILEGNDQIRFAQFQMK